MWVSSQYDIFENLAVTDGKRLVLASDTWLNIE